jgi:hypothetical protein
VSLWAYLEGGEHMPFEFNTTKHQLSDFRLEDGKTYRPFGSYIYGWRTVARAAPQSNSSVFGIPVPDMNGKSLIERMAAHKEYLEALDRQLVLSAQKDPENKRVSLTDTGNIMTILKYQGNMPHVRSKYDRVQTGQVYWDKTLPKGALLNLSSSALPSGIATPAKWNSIQQSLFLNLNGIADIRPFISSSDRQGVANYFFSSTIPDNPGSKIGELLVGLLRGDAKRLISGFSSLPRIVEQVGGVKKVKKALNEGGSQYLNAVFGWMPSINDIHNFIQTLLSLSDSIYGESYRRERFSKPEPQVWERQGTLDFSTYKDFLSDVPTVQDGAGGSFPGTYTVTSSRDHFFRARYSGIAKPNPAAKGYMEKAMEELKRTGVVYDALVWDLTPYSWLIDWFVTMGHSISNANAYAPLSGRYNVDYAYLTTRYIVTCQFRPSQRYYQTNSSGYRNQYWWDGGNSFVSLDIKHREQATPFGFGTRLDSLTQSQFQILAALGLAKVR